MSFFLDIAAMLAFRTRALRAVAARRAVAAAFVILSVGFLAFVIIRNMVYAELQENAWAPGILSALFRLNLLQVLVFLSVVYVPGLICLSNALAGEGLGLSISREEYQTHISVLFPLWGVLFLIAAPLQWFAPEFLVLGFFGISVGLLTLTFLLTVFTVWAVKELNYISVAASVGVFALSWITLPLFYLLTMFFLALPFFIMIPLLYLAFQRLRGYFAGREGENAFQQHLHSLMVNPQDADAHHQLGLIHLRRGKFDAAQKSFENALKIDPSDSDYHYFLGKVFEAKGDWPKALEAYEETYRLNPEYRLGDIFREVGKGYLHVGRTEKAVEFLRFFLQSRGSDPEGRYWLAVALQKLGQFDEMRVQLNTILEQARSNPRFFCKENREWVFRARTLLRSSSQFAVGSSQ